MMVVNYNKVTCKSDVCDKLVNKFMENLLGRIEYYRTVLPDDGWIEYRTTLRFGSQMRVNRFNVADEAENRIKEALRLLMKQELLNVLNQTYKELGVVDKKDKEVDLPQNSYETTLTIDD
mgnify:FL=1